MYVHAQDSDSAVSNERLIVARIMADRELFKRYEEFRNPRNDSAAVRYAIQAHFALRYNQLQKANLLLSEARKSSKVDGFPTEDFAIVLDLLESRLWERQDNYEALLASPIYGSILKRSGRGIKWKLGLNYVPEFRKLSSGSNPLLNIAPGSKRIVVEAFLDAEPVRVMLDSGGGETVLFPSADNHFAFQTTSEQIEIEKPGFQATPARLVVLESLDLASSSFHNLISVVLDNAKHPLSKSSRRHNFDVLLGARELLKYGGLSLVVKQNRIETVSIGRPSFIGHHEGAPNLLVRDSRPYIKVEIGTYTYACLFDTGASVSYISRKMLLENMDSKGWKLHRNNVREMQVSVGDKIIPLRNVEVKDWHGAGCLIGLDAVISAGGVKVDFQAPRIEFAPPN